MPVLRGFFSGVLKVAHLLLLVLVSVLGAPNAEIDGATDSLRSAFRVAVQQTPAGRLYVPQQLAFLNSRLLDVQRRVTEEVDLEMIRLLSAEISALYVECVGAAPDLQPIYTIYIGMLQARLDLLDTQLAAGAVFRLQVKRPVFESVPLTYFHSGTTAVGPPTAVIPPTAVAPPTAVDPPGPSPVVSAVAVTVVDNFPWKALYKDPDIKAALKWSSSQKTFTEAVNEAVKKHIVEWDSVHGTVRTLGARVRLRQRTVHSLYRDKDTIFDEPPYSSSSSSSSSSSASSSSSSSSSSSLSSSSSSSTPTPPSPGPRPPPHPPPPPPSPLC